MYVGPDIVQNGLVAVFDAGSTRSYPGTGSTWYNLIGTVNGALSTTSIGTTTAGTMTFDGVDDSIDIPLASLTSTDFTVIGVSGKISGSNGRLISAKQNNWLLGHHGTGSRKYYSEGWVAQTYSDSSNNVHIYCGTGNISGDVYSFREDNVNYTQTASGGSQGPNGFSLGRYAIGSNEYGTGTITVLLVYNRVLTDAEIDQNFNAQKNRFL
jgi:hypothetical protein